MELVTVILLGFFLGLRHATDPDHVIAVTTIVSRERTIWTAVRIGLMWGIGHSVTVVAVGSVIILAGATIPPRLGLTMEFGVALMLIVLGLLNLTGLARWLRDALAIGGDAAARHSHAHRHGDYVHTHLHGHAGATHGHAEEATPQARLDRAFGRLGLYHLIRPLVVGIVHGLAGSAAVALLVLATIRDPWWALDYLLVFSVGTIAGMMLITATLALPLAYTAGRHAQVSRVLATASGLASLAFGLFLAYQIGFVQGLFGSDPHWTPE
jgi:High-affinity nickel-transport protein